MAVIKCKMCGGDLSIAEGKTVAECEYCGTAQTVPTADSEKKLTLFGRANRLRLACEFDKAAGVYESIVAEFPEEAEAYWGLVLCRYGIEYVDDPRSGGKIPTCHRSSFDSIMEDSDFEQTLENADVAARKVYRDEAKAIEKLRKGILEVSGKEEPYDIFICYKETDENGDRTIDSVIAQDVYDTLTEKGYRVFFSRISLEDKLGTEYEPYIFAALNSARVMLAFGTSYEHYNAVWVKNEWSRFLALIAAGQKKTLVPCYKGIDAYDMPKEFQRLQAQDMGKVGAIQDLLRGIEKILNVKKAVGSPAPAVQQSGMPSVVSLLERGMLCLEDANWDKAGELFDQVLNIDPKCAEAYLGLAMTDSKCRTRDNLLAICTERAEKGDAGFSDTNFVRARQFAKGELQTWFKALEDAAEARKRKAEERQQEEESQRRDSLSQLRQRFTPAARLADCGTVQTGSVSTESPLVQRRRRGALAAKRIGIGCVVIEKRLRTYLIGMNMDGTVVAAGDNYYGQCNVKKWTDIVSIAVGPTHTVGLKSDGTVVDAGDNYYGQCNVKKWTDIVSIAVGPKRTFGLKPDGTVAAAGIDVSGSYNAIGAWADIVAISDEGSRVVELRSNGTVIAKTYGAGISNWNWTDIVAIADGGWHTVGLKSNGTVVAVGDTAGCDAISGWTDIVSIAVGDTHTVGLKADGTVAAVGKNGHGECNINAWSDIVAIAAGRHHTVGLKLDGTVVAVGGNEFGQCNVSGWTDIVAVAARHSCTVGIRIDGTVVNTFDPDWTKGWKLFNHADTIKQEVAKVQERRRSSLESEKYALHTELNGLNGLFTGKRRREIEARLFEIEAELKKL